MADPTRSRPRARSDVDGSARRPRSSPDDREPDFLSPRRAATTATGLAAGDPRRLRRAETQLSAFPEYDSNSGFSLRRRATARSRQTGAETKSRMTTMAGPEDTSQLRAAHEPFVQQGYAELNPSYDQPANTKPVWSLAKPLPRVVRPGMAPTASEIFESRVNAEMPGENSQALGLDVDPNDLEKGKVQFTPDPRKISAQLKDARTQRENNFITSLQRRRAQSRVSGTGGLALVDTQTSRRRSSAAMRPVLDMTWADTSGDERLQSPLQDPQDATSPRKSQEQRRSHDDQDPHVDHLHSAPLGPQSTLEPIMETSETRPPSLAETLSTLHADDDPELWKDMDPIHLEYVEEEIHNNHTAWSVVRTANREFLAELLAVFIQLTVGFCSDLAVTLTDDGDPNTTEFAWGFSTMMAIYVSGGISGAHLNPVITTMLWWFRGFPKGKMPAYFLAQFLGALIAGFTAYGLYYASIHDYLSVSSHSTADIVDSFVTSQRYTYIDATTAFFNEFLATAILAATVLALGDDQNAPPGAGMNAFIIGLVVCTLSLAFAYQTGAALNPSRDFGPRLALLALGYGKELFTNPYWFYGPWAATLLGAFTGASLYDICIFIGGESPINYPMTRTKRSLKKSKKKWARRLRLAKKKKEINDQPWGNTNAMQ